MTNLEQKLAVLPTVEAVHETDLAKETVLNIIETKSQTEKIFNWWNTKVNINKLAEENWVAVTLELQEFFKLEGFMDPNKRMPEKPFTLARVISEMDNEDENDFKYAYAA